MNEEMRKEFEEWCKQQWFVNLETKNDVYISSKTNILWLAWQASREAMKPIKLPMWCVTSDGPSKYLLQYEVIEAIQQAGYKVE